MFIVVMMRQVHCDQSRLHSHRTIDTFNLYTWKRIQHMRERTHAQLILYCFCLISEELAYIMLAIYVYIYMVKLAQSYLTRDQFTPDDTIRFRFVESKRTLNLFLYLNCGDWLYVCFVSTVMNQSCFQASSTGWWNLASSCSSLFLGKWFWLVMKLKYLLMFKVTTAELSPNTSSVVKTILRFQENCMIIRSLAYDYDLCGGVKVQGFVVEG